MTAPHDADRLVHAFLQDGPAELSPPLLARIRDEVRETKQRTVRRPWRTPSMPRTILFIAPLAAALVAVGALVLAGSGSRTPGPSPVPSAAPTVAPVATSGVVSSASVKPGPTPYPLAAGEPWIVIGGDDRGVLIRPDGTDQHTILTDIGVTVWNPAWSPDGQQLVFEGNGDRGSQLWVANADGTGAHAVTPAPPGCPNGVCAEAVHAAWSPDGKTIAYISPQHERGAFTGSSLALLDVASGQITEVYTTTTTGLGRPAWSPDSQKIALEIDRYAGAVETSALQDTMIGVVDLRATDRTPKTITDPTLLAGYPTWHPSQDRIVFRTNPLIGDPPKLVDPKAASNLYTIRPDGTGLTAVTDNEVGIVVRAPSWTPDGRILYSRKADASAVELLRIIKEDGSGEASATGQRETADEGRWRPTP